MARVSIPDHLLPKLGPEMKMDTHWIDVRLRDGRCIANLVVRGGLYITGHAGDSNGEGSLTFEQAEIIDIRRHSIFGVLRPF